LSLENANPENILNACLNAWKTEAKVFLFVHFLHENTFFPVLCYTFTHISFKALDFLYFRPLFYGNVKITIYNFQLCISNVLKIIAII